MSCHHRVLFALALVATNPLAGCGGTDGRRPLPTSSNDPAAVFADPGPTIVDCGADRGLQIETFEDFELGAGTGWCVSNDNTPGVFEKPTPDTCNVPSEAIPGGRCASAFALHVYGGAFTIWGSGIAAGLPHTPYDLSRFTGLSFWARKGPVGLSNLVVGLRDYHNDYTGAAQEPDAEKGVSVCLPFCPKDTPDGAPQARCAPSDDPNRPLEQRKLDCGGDYATGVVLTSEWKFYKIAFADLRQDGWRFVSPSFDTSRVWSFDFNQWVGYDDTWIDDVGFYTE